MDSGIYIVTLKNNEPISVNANDPRVAIRSIKVTKANCKVGKARSLEARKKSYFKTFGEHNVNFMPVALIEDIALAEKAVLARLDGYRIRGSAGRKNEWLEGIEANEVLELVLHTLKELGVSYEILV